MKRAIAALFAVLLLLPFFASPYILALFLLIFMYIALAESWNILSGYTGYVSFGHVAFFGIGAYTAALLITQKNFSWIAASLLGGVVAVLFASVIGFICLRLRGPYFAIALLGLNEAIRVIATAWESLTRGGYGISLPPVLDLKSVYYAMLLSAASAVLLTYALAGSRFGLRLMAIREDEVGAEAVGINTTSYKQAAFILSSFFPGVVGGVYAYYLSYIEPESVFSVSITVKMIVMSMFGGAGTVLGSVIGATSLALVSELFWAKFPYLHQALFGAIIVAVVLFVPGGVVALLQERNILPKGRRV